MRIDESDYFSPSQLDFVPRDRRSQSNKLLVAFVVIMALVFVAGYAPSLQRTGYAPFIAIASIATLCVYVVIRYQQILDLLMTTEHRSLESRLAAGGH